MIEFEHGEDCVFVNDDGGRNQICYIEKYCGKWLVTGFYDAVGTNITAADLRQIADKLDELNNAEVSE